MTSPVSTLRQQAYVTQPNPIQVQAPVINDQPPSRVVADTLDVINNDVITGNGVPGMLMPVDGGYMFYCPPDSDVNTLTSQGRVVSLNAKNRMTSPIDDEGYGTSRTLGQRSTSQKSERKKKVPTLKRKLSEWEKQQIRKGTLHI